MTTEPASVQPTIDPDTLNLIYDAVKGVPDHQLQNGRAMDTKIMQIFTAAGVIIGLAGFARTPLQDNRAVDYLLVLGAIAYAVTAVFVLRHMRVRDYAAPVAPTQLWNTATGDSPASLKISLVSNIVTAYQENLPVLAAKAKTLQRAMYGLAAEVTCVALAMVVTQLA